MAQSLKEASPSLSRVSSASSLGNVWWAICRTVLTGRRDCEELFRILSLSEESGASQRKTVGEREFVQLFAKPLMQSAILNLYALVESSDLLSADFPLSLRLLRHQRRLFLSSLAVAAKPPSSILGSSGLPFGMDGRAAMETLGQLSARYSSHDIEE